jgi:outer membrane protein
MSKIGSVVLLLLAAPAARAQQPLTLADATARALARNHDIRIEREAVDTANARALSAQGSYDPRLKVDASGRHHRDPITTLFSGAPPGEVAASQTGFSSSASISQLFKTGATASASASVGRDMTDSFFTLFAPAYTTSLGVEIRQPLLRSRAVDSARTSLRITALDRDRTGAVLDQQVLDVVAAVEKAYWALVAARREVEVRRNGVALAGQQRADTETRIAARTVAALDLAQPTAEVERRRGDLLAAQESAARAERALKLLMLDDPADAQWTVEFTPTEAPEVETKAVDVERALADAASHRPELAALGTDVSTSDAQVALAKDNLRPQVDLVASYTSRGLAGDHNPGAIAFPGVPSSGLPAPLSGGLGTSLHTLADNRFPDASIGVSVDVPLGRRAARGDLSAAQAQRRQAALRLSQARDQIAVDVRNAATALETASSRIQAARAGLGAAETQLRAEQERFTAGASTSFFVLTRQNDLALAQLAEIAALTDYRKALTDVGRATGMLLVDRGITVGGASNPDRK